MSKAEFIENIQKWVKIDTQIKAVNEKIKKARDVKHELLEHITKYAEENQLEKTKIEISDGELRFCEKREYKPITFSYVEECLGKIITDTKQVEYIMTHLRENREVKVSKDMKRSYA
jgi:hypothetical protein